MKHPFLIILLVVMSFVASSFLFSDKIIETAGPYVANQLQDQLDFKFSHVQSRPFRLETRMRVGIIDKKTKASIGTSEKVDISIELEGLRLLFDVKIKDSTLALSEDLLERLITTNLTSLKMLKTFTSKELRVDVDGAGASLHLSVSDLAYNSVKKEGILNGLNVDLDGQKQRLLEVSKLGLRSIAGRPSLIAEKVHTHVSQNSIEAVVKLIPFDSFPSLAEFASIEVKEASLSSLDRHVRSSLRHGIIDFPTGEATLSGLHADWSRRKQKLLDLRKLSASFSTGDIAEKRASNIQLVVTGLRLHVGKDLRQLIDREKAELTSFARTHPVTISQLLIGTSSVTFLELPGIGDQKHLQLRKVFGHVNDLHFRKGPPFARFNLNATFEGETKLMAHGRFDPLSSPTQASVDYRLFAFDMRKLDPKLRGQLPKQFQTGVFDLVGEVIRKEEPLVGYFKAYHKGKSTFKNKKDAKKSQNFFAIIGRSIRSWFVSEPTPPKVSSNIAFVYKNGRFDFKARPKMWEATTKSRGRVLRVRQAQEAR